MTVTTLLLRLGLVLAAVRLLGVPVARLAFPRLPGAAYALGGPVGLVIAGHLTWLLVHAGMPLGPVSIGLGWLALGFGAWRSIVSLRRGDIPALPRFREALRHHVAFIVMFALALAITARNPAVDPDSERFMDYAMFNGVLASRALPLEDPWLAGERVSYYDYGYYSAAYLTILAGGDPRTFLIAIALMHAALFAGVFALGWDLAGPAGGVLAGLFVSLAGNLDAAGQTIEQLLRAGPLVVLAHGFEHGLDWFQSARVLAGGIITEFPFFALLWGDLHPYAMALPLWPILLGVAAVIVRERAAPATVLVGAVTFAALVATHTWDAVPMGFLLLLCGVMRLRAGGGWRSALGGPALVVVAGLVLSAPYLEALPTGGRGLGWVTVPSTFIELFVAWGVPLIVITVAGVTLLAPRADHPLLAPALLFVAAGLTLAPRAGVATVAALALTCLLLALATAGSGAEGVAEGGPDPAAAPQPLAWAMAATALGLIAGVEVLYVDDHYTGSLERMNTVFKAYVEAWVLIAFATAILVAWLLAKARPRGALARVLVGALVALVVGLSAIYPVRATAARAGTLWEPLGLDPARALRQLYPDDALAIAALRAQPRGVILESSGDPYSWDSRFATFTGYPTVLGWGHHEAGWRNTWEPITARSADVERAYKTESLAELREILRAYHVRYVVVGALERERYSAAELAKLQVFHPLVRAGETVVYSTDPEAQP